MYSFLLALALLLTIASCKSYRKDSEDPKIKDVANQSTVSSCIEIVVGIYDGENSESEFEQVFDGIDSLSLSYFIDGDYLGKGLDGANILSERLRNIPMHNQIVIKNPFVAHLPDRLNPDVLNGSNNIYPYVENIEIQEKIVKELDRIRGLE